MAHLRRDSKSGNYFIRFRYAGRSFNRSLKTPHEHEAEAIRGRIEETILLIERGRIEMPSDADPAHFILSDGKRLGKPIKPKVSSLEDFFQIYNNEMPLGAKDAETLKANAGIKDCFLNIYEVRLPFKLSRRPRCKVTSHRDQKTNGMAFPSVQKQSQKN